MRGAAVLVVALGLAACSATEGDGPGADEEPAIRLVRPASPTAAERIPLRGYGVPGQRVDLHVNGIFVGSTSVSVTGEFRFADVSLDRGANLIEVVPFGTGGSRLDDGRSRRQRGATAARLRVVRTAP